MSKQSVIETKSSLRDRILKNSSIKDTAILATSTVFGEREMVSVAIPALNIAFSGSLTGGFTSGLTQWCGPSKHFKTMFTLIMAKAYMDKYPESILLFYDSEFGTPQAYFQSVGIDMTRVIHTPITNIEEFKFDMMAQLQGLSKGDKLFIAVDSVGNLASLKEVDDAIKGESKTDMTRAKQLKSCFRMFTPYLALKDIPMVVVNHIYMTQEMYSKAVVSGGTGIYLSSDNIYIIGRQQEKDDDGVAGYNFVINIEKSRHSREKMKIPVTVMHEGGLNKWSGLLSIAQESGHVIKPKNGWYAKVDKSTGEIQGKNYRADETNSSAFWNSIMADPTFNEYIISKYKASNGDLVLDDTPELEAELEED